MKTYFNQNDRTHNLMMLIIWDYFSSWLENASCLTSTERKKIKTAATNLLHASDSIIGRLDEDYEKRLMRQAKDTEVRLVSKASHALAVTGQGVYIDKEDFKKLAYYLLQGCKGCKAQNHKGCGRYMLFMKLNVPVIQEQTNGCPFEIKGA